MNHRLRGLKDYTDKYINKIKRDQKSVKSFNQFKSVIQTSNDIVKAHGGKIKVETKEGDGAEIIIQLPVV